VVAKIRQAEIDLQKHLADNGIDLERMNCKNGRDECAPPQRARAA